MLCAGMGQGCAGVKDDMGCAVGNVGQCQWNCVDRRPGDDYVDYFTQFSAGSRDIPLNQSQLAINLQERHVEPTCWNMAGKALAGHDHELYTAEGHKPFKTDFCSLIAPDGDGIGFGEVCRAICVTTKGYSSDGMPDPDSGCQVRDTGARLGRASLHMDGEVLLDQAPSVICVPPEFRTLEYDWSAPSNAQPRPSLEQQAKLERCLKPFVVAMMPGIIAQLRLDADEMVGANGAQNLDAIISLTHNLSLLLISVMGVERSVPLRSVRWVRPPEDMKQSWFLPSDQDKMVVIRLAGGRFVRLRFGKKEQAAYFGTCMRLLVKASRTHDSNPPSDGAVSSQATEPLLHQPSGVMR